MHSGEACSPLGYSEGKTSQLSPLHWGRSDRAEELADDLVRRSVNVIVAHFTPGGQSGASAPPNHPDCHGPAGAPLQSGFVKASLILEAT